MKHQASQEVNMADSEMDLLEEEIFLDCTFDVPPDEMPPQSFGTPPMFVPSIGRGVRREINPLDIPLPQAYYEQLERKTNTTRAENPRFTHPDDIASKPNRRYERPAPPRDQGPSMPHPRPRGRGRGRVIEDGYQKAKPSVLQVKDLAHAGLPNGIGDVEEGKARLMQMFLGRQSQFEIDAQFNAQYDSSGSSIRSAPNFDLKNNLDFPDMISKVIKGVPFQTSGGGGSLDENLRRRARGVLAARARGNSSGDDGVSSSGDTGERKGVRSSCGTDADMSNDPSLTSQQRSNANSSQALAGPNVLELIGLPSNLSKEDLGDLLMGCGTIIEMRLLRDPDSGACIGMAYVRMEDENACQLAISSYHDIESPFSDRYDGDIPQLSVRLLQT